jgi:uncharacterized membrane protein
MAAQGNQQTSRFNMLNEIQLNVWQRIIYVLAHTWGLLILLLLAVIVLGYIFQWPWTGFQKKTLWDWMQLLIFPLVLAVLTVWFSTQKGQDTVQKGQNIDHLETIAELHAKGRLTNEEFIAIKAKLLRSSSDDD